MGMGDRALASVLLVTPSDSRAGFEYVQSGRENLGVEYLLSAVRHAGHDAESVNENLPGERSLDDLDFAHYDVVGFSLPFWEYRRRYVDLINRVAPRARPLVIAGGHAATIGAEYFLLRCPKLDGVVMGEGELTITDLLASPDHAEGVPGFYTRSGFTKRRLESIDALPPPARDELGRSLAGSPPFKEGYIASSRGCTNACSFCSIPTYYRVAHDQRWRERSVAGICEEVDGLLRTCPDLDALSFTDDNFLGFRVEHRQRAIAIAQHIHATAPQLTFEIACRAEAVDDETFRRLAELGLSGVYLGIESGVQRILDSFRKRTTVEQNLRSIQVLSRAGVGCDVGFIMFSPTITLCEIRENLDFLRHVLDNYPVFVHPGAVFRRLRTYPGDLGRAAAEERDDHFAPLPMPVNALREALELLWQDTYEAEFLRLERLAACGTSQSGSSIEESRQITLQMIEHATRMFKELEARPGQSSLALLESACGDVKVRK